MNATRTIEAVKAAGASLEVRDGELVLTGASLLDARRARAGQTSEGRDHPGVKRSHKTAAQYARPRRHCRGRTRRPSGAFGRQAERRRHRCSAQYGNVNRRHVGGSVAEGCVMTKTIVAGQKFGAWTVARIDGRRIWCICVAGRSVRSRARRSRTARPAAVAVGLRPARGPAKNHRRRISALRSLRSRRSPMAGRGGAHDRGGAPLAHAVDRPGGRVPARPHAPCRPPRRSPTGDVAGRRRQRRRARPRHPGAVARTIRFKASRRWGAQDRSRSWVTIRRLRK